MKSGQVHHIEYYVQDIAKTKEFWGWFLQELGYKHEYDFSNGFTYSHQSGTYFTFVEIDPELKSFKNNRNASGLNHIAFYVESPEKLKTVESGLVKRGALLLKSDDKHICFEELNSFAVEVFL